MTWLLNILCFIILHLVLVRPAPMIGKETRIPLQQSHYGSKVSSSLHGNTHSQGIKHPPYLMQLYKTLIMGNETDLFNPENFSLQDSDTVLSLTAKSCTEVDNHWDLTFDMSSISSNNEIQLAELRINSPSLKKTHHRNVDIYDSKNGQRKFFLGSLHTTSFFTLGSSWNVFNLTKKLNYYLQHRQHYNTEEITDTSDKVQESSCGELSTDRVVLVVFIKDKTSTNQSRYSNLIQTVKSSKYVMSPETRQKTVIQRYRNTRKANHNIIRNKAQSIPTEDGRPLCRRVDMIVDFEKFGWGDQIIYPKRFNAYRCEGDCPAPLNEMFKPTNHAYIMSLVKLHDSKTVVCSSCAPIKMSPLSMMLYEDGKVVVKRHKDMIIEECGCQ